MSTDTDGAPPSVAREPADGSGPEHGPEVEDPDAAAIDTGSMWLREEIARRIAAKDTESGGRHARRDGKELTSTAIEYVPRHATATPGPAAEAPQPVGGSAGTPPGRRPRRNQILAQAAGSARSTAWSGPLPTDPVPDDPVPDDAAPNPALPDPASPDAGPPSAANPNAPPRAAVSGPGRPSLPTSVAAARTFGGPSRPAPPSGSAAARLLSAPPSTAPAPTAPASTGPASTAPAPTAPASTGPAPTGPAPTGPAPTGPAPSAPAPTQAPSTQAPTARPPTPPPTAPPPPARSSPAAPPAAPPNPPSPTAAPPNPASVEPSTAELPTAAMPTVPEPDESLDSPAAGGVVWTARTPPAEPPGAVMVPEQRTSEQVLPGPGPAGLPALGQPRAEPVPRPGRRDGASPAKRVRVVLAERKGVARPVRTVVDIQEGTGVGELLRSNLIGSQLTVALRFAVGVGLTLGLLPLLFALVPEIGRTEVLGLRLPWLLLGVLVYPFLLGMGWWHTRTVERVEQNFADHVQD